MSSRNVHTFYWPGEMPCAKRHQWAGELLHTFVAPGHVVTTRTCSLCGAVRISREPSLTRFRVPTN